MISKFLRRFLGLDADMEFLTKKLNYQADSFMREFDELRHDIKALRDRNADLSRNVRTQMSGLGRIIAKLDPMYGRPEAQPIIPAEMDAASAQRLQEDWAKRKAESDRLGEAAINRLFAEQDARDRNFPSGSQGTR